METQMESQIESTNDDVVFKKKVGELDVLINEHIHVSGDNIVEIGFGELVMKFKFVTDSECKDSKYNREIEENVMTWELTNFKKPLGEGILEPLDVGYFNEKKLYITFFVWTVNEEKGLRIINYSFYLGKENEK